MFGGIGPSTELMSVGATDVYKAESRDEWLRAPLCEPIVEMLEVFTMTNDNKESKNNASCEEKQEARQLTPDELANVTGGATNPHKKDLGSIAMSYGYVYVANAPDNIKPDETVSLDVLKDAASAAIYGSSKR